MNRNTTQAQPPCGRAFAESFLSDDLDPQTQQAFEVHLSDCELCRQRLSELAGEDQWWVEAREFLSGEDNATKPPDQDTDSDELQIDSNDIVDLQFLAPTDDPRMLGRLGSHEICGVIGRGGMGIVLKALDPSLNRFVAIKVLSPHLAVSGAARQRFAREAQAAAAVVHEHVIAIHAVETRGSLPYLIMPYVKGESLQQRIDREGALPLTEVLRIGMQVARGLSAAHDQGLVHRDIKPGNILLPQSVERVIITDFGLARAVDDATLTQSGTIAGTPQYLSPEQARGDAIDHRADLFALGSLLYTAAGGRPPFRGETPYAIIRKIVEKEPRPLRQINESVPGWFQELLSTLHAKSPDERFSSARQLADTMEQCLAFVQTGQGSLPSSLVATKPRLARVRDLAIVACLAAATIAVTWLGTWPTPAASTTPSAATTRDTHQSPDALLTEIDGELDRLLNELTDQGELP